MIQLFEKTPLWLSREKFSQLSRAVASVLVLVSIGAFTTANGAIVTDDGDFAAQTIGNPVGSPWDFVSGSGNAASVDAQSPFTNLFANNGKGINTPATAGAPYFVGTFSPTVGTAATNTLLFNVDFRNNTTDPGDYSFVITNGGAGAQRSVALYVTGAGFFAESDAGVGASVFTPIEDLWYNVQLTIDAGANTYSGTVTPFGGAPIAITSRNFVTTTNTISAIYTDTGIGVGAGAAPDHDIDNFALDVQPAPPTPPVGPPTPRLTVDFNGNIGAELTPASLGTAVLPAGNGQVYNNVYNASFSDVPLVDHNGNATGITVSAVGVNAQDSNVGQFDSTNSGTTAFQDALVTIGVGTTGTVTLSGLTGPAYDLYLFGYFNSQFGESGTFTVNGSSPQTTLGSDSSTTGFNLGEDYVRFSNVAPNNLGNIVITFRDANNEGVGVFNGFQLVAVPEPTAFGLIVVGLAGLAGFRRRGICR